MYELRRIILWCVIIIAFIGIVLYFLFVGPKTVPADFVDARHRGAVLAEAIAFLAMKTTDSLREIAQDDSQKNIAEGLMVISREQLRNKEFSDRAVQLSTELAKMAASAPQITPAKGRAIALEGIGYEMALVSRLIVYNDNLRDLFDLLRLKLNGSLPDAHTQVQNALINLNASATGINALNQVFQDAMRRFDNYYPQ